MATLIRDYHYEDESEDPEEDNLIPQRNIEKIKRGQRLEGDERPIKKQKKVKSHGVFWR